MTHLREIAVRPGIAWPDALTCLLAGRAMGQAKSAMASYRRQREAVQGQRAAASRHARLIRGNYFMSACGRFDE
jgi:hypothetical protein